jgi:alpha-tubulin suppressor-like RCC1 family protein
MTSGNFSGQLSDGTTTQRHAPVEVLGISGVDAIAAGQDYSLALLSNGTVSAWGWNHRGQLGDGTTTDSSTPVQVAGITDAETISAGITHSLAVRSDGSVVA